MGPDTTHGCWSGSYNAFMCWREGLHQLIQPPADTRSLKRAWADGLYDDQSVPI